MNITLFKKGIVYDMEGGDVDAVQGVPEIAAAEEHRDIPHGPLSEDERHPGRARGTAQMEDVREGNHDFMECSQGC